MPFYNDLRPKSDHEERDFVRVGPQDMAHDDKLRCIDGILRLKDKLQGPEHQVPRAGELRPRKTESNLLIASWNIVSFGAGGYRTTEALYYIAEILSNFDLIAIQEVKPQLADLDRIVRILGPNWAYMVNDATGGDAGNDERSAYLYNSHRVRPSGIVGEISMWDELREDSLVSIKDLKRPAYMTGFVTGWKEFALVNLHLHPGEKKERVKDGVTLPADATIRQEEIKLLLAALADRKEELWTNNLVLVGDMNFYRGKDDDTINLIHAAGFWESAGLVGKTTNITVDPRDAEVYDRMFFSGDEDRDNNYFRIAVDEAGMEQGGVLNPFTAVYRPDDWTDYRVQMSQKHSDPAKGANLLVDDVAAQKYYRDTFRKRQMSDHYLIWVELSVDDSVAFLTEKRSEVDKERRADDPGAPIG